MVTPSTALFNSQRGEKSGTIGLPDNFKVNELLITNAKKPEFYNKAMLELKRLEDEPICHRLAAQLLINTCNGLQTIDESTLQSTKARLQRNHVESFAAALTLCDMEGVNWEIPEPCMPLSSAAMHQALRQEQRTLVVPPDDVQACLTTLSQDHTHWMTWLHRRDSALLFCRAASVDMDKDQLFESQKILVKIMADFATGLEAELESLKNNMRSHSKDADVFFEGLMNHADGLKSKFHGTMESVASDIKNVAASIASIKNSGSDINRFLKSVFQTAVEGNAEMVAKQEQALVASTSNFQNRLEGINDMAQRTEEYALMLGQVIDQISSRLQTLADQQDLMGEKSDGVLTALLNATDLFQTHATQLEKARMTANKIHDSLGNVASITKLVSTFADKMTLSGRIGDWMVRLVVPPATVFLGSYGLPPSLSRNALLLVGGGGISESIVHLRRWAPIQWYMNSLANLDPWEWYPESFEPSTFTHLVRTRANPKAGEMIEDLFTMR
ncbi:hypothetical protein HYALB_00007875 [Hymenoscyphus albidus]|uniref:Nuclear membrane fusion protein Kar5 n=1 Tax=Hymenoscyphus albidus TaxID=595503 RepID=A0A9N9LMB0_9HELO|nr:hypothetical protein HYALB_00007875 [Hymenoscyphus albidus]